MMDYTIGQVCEILDNIAASLANIEDAVVELTHAVKALTPTEGSHSV